MAKLLEDARRQEWIALAKRAGYSHAADIIADGDMSQEWMFAELIIAFAVGRERGQESVFYDVAAVESSKNHPIDDFGLFRHRYGSVHAAFRAFNPLFMDI